MGMAGLVAGGEMPPGRPIANAIPQAVRRSLPAQKPQHILGV